MDQQLDEPDLRSYLGVIARRKWLVAAVVTVVLGVAAGVSFLAEKQYEVTAQVQTTSSTDPVALVLSEGAAQSDPNRDAENQAAYLESTNLRFAVLDACQPDVLPCSAVWDVEGEPVARSEDPNRVPSVVELTLVAADPDEAANLLDLYVRTYVEQLRREQQQEMLALMSALSAEVARINTEIERLPADQEATAAALGDTAAAYNDWAFQLRFSAGMANGSGAMVLSRPSVPESPVSPRWDWNLAIGLLFGLFLGIALAFLRDYFDDSIKSKEMAEQVTGLPVLGLIPRFDTGESELVAATAPSAPAAEAFRSLRTSVKFLAVEREVRVVQVTSPSPGEGKTVVAANLATVFAQAGDRVVLVGADLRRPRAEEMLGVPLTPGLTGVLIGEVSLPQAIRGVEGMPNLSVLPAGYPPPNPSELLSGERARRLVDVLAQTYDVVLIDSPPVLPVSDALVLARMADATLLVTAANRTSKRALDRAVEVLQQVSAPLFGTIMTSLAPGATYSGTYGGGTYRYDEPVGSRHKGAKRPVSAVPLSAVGGSPSGHQAAGGDGNGTADPLATSHWQPADGGRQADPGAAPGSSIWGPEPPSQR